MPAPDEAKAIEVRVEEIAQLFDTLDPFPFRERDLDKHAEEYIVTGRASSREITQSRSLFTRPKTSSGASMRINWARHWAGILTIAPRLSAAISTSCFV
jgi:hypothetical protein